jgi:MHS family proline/betaine transporter-like MFS transporter
MQGLSVGGQLMSSVVFTLERTDEKRWGVWGSSVFAASGLGVSIGSLFSYILRSKLNDEQLLSWGWRLPFLFGAFGVLPGAYLKYRGREHPIPPAAATEPEQSGSPTLERQSTFSETFSPANRRALIAATLVPCLGSATYYIVYIWMVIFMETIVEPPVPHAFAINTAVGIIGIPMVFVGGMISDYCRGHYRLIMLLSSIFIGSTSPLFLHWIGMGNPGVAFACQLTMGLVLCILNGAMIPWMIRSFPPHVRLTSVNIGYNLAVSICGGFAPAMATLLVDKYNNSTPGFIMTGLAVVVWLGLWIAPKQEMEAIEEDQSGGNNNKLGNTNLSLEMT